MKEFFSTNRKKAAECLPDNSVLILFAGSEPVNFYYLTGIQSPGIMFVLYKHGGKVKETLYLERYDEKKAKWVGAPLSADEAEQISGIKEHKNTDEFESDVAALLFACSPDVWFDLDTREFGAPL